MKCLYCCVVSLICYGVRLMASSLSSRGRGVIVVLNDTIQSARATNKTNTTGVQTFASPNSWPIGYVDPASVRFLMPGFQPDSRTSGIPFIGTYSNALPISLAAASTVAGQYTIEADAASGATQSTNVNLVTNPTGVNFAF